jgi:hypothetical protein
MYNLSQAFHRARKERNQRPEIVFVLVTAFGAHVYSDRQPSEKVLRLTSPPRADGTYLADGSITGGIDHLDTIDWGAHALSLGRLRESLSPAGKLLATFQTKEKGSWQVVLANSGPQGRRRFSRMEAQEQLVGAKGYLTIGYPAVEARDYMQRFEGKVEVYKLEADRLTLTLREE